VLVVASKREEKKRRMMIPKPKDRWNEEEVTQGCLSSLCIEELGACSLLFSRPEGVSS